MNKVTMALQTDLGNPGVADKNKVTLSLPT
jgi:hypothetical protein